jgi:predicted aspartyl protease
VRLGILQYPDYEFDVEALVDTGFDGGLTVRQAVIPGHVTPRGQQRCTLADGSQIDAYVYRGFVTIGALQPLATYIIVLPHQALLGRAVTNHFRLTFLYGRRVILES